MRITRKTIIAAHSLVRYTYANLDVMTLNTNRNTWIEEATATLVLGNVPSPITGDVALWSAIMMDKRDFLQGVTQNSPGSGYCSNLGSNWCNFAYTLVGSSSPTVGTPVIASVGARVKTHYKLNSQTNLWDQNLYVNGKLLSNVSTSRGQHGKTFYISIECASGKCATAPAHRWENISVTLNQADQNFAHSGVWKYNATGGIMSTPDNGKTWNFTTLLVPDTPVS